MKFTFNLKKLIVIEMLCVLNFYVSNAQGLLVDNIIGIVGDKVILYSELDIQYQQYISQNVEDNGELRCQVFDQMLKDKMMLMQAFVDSIEISEEEVNNELERRIRHFTSYFGSEEKLEEKYEKSIIEIKEEFREDIRNQLLSNKMRSNIIKNVRITPSEVKEFFKQIPQDSLPFFNAEIEVGQIVRYPKVNHLQDSLAKSKIKQLRERIIKGENFSTLAILYSDDAVSAKNGGELGFMERGELVAEFQEAAFPLKVGEISDIVKTEFGYHIIQMIARRGEKINVRHILVKPTISASALNTANKLLDSIRYLIINDSIDFSTGVNLYSEDEASKNSGGILMNSETGGAFFEISQLDATIYFTIENLKVGEISKPVLFITKNGKQAYRILYLKTETKPHRANLKEDYNKIQTAALNAKQNNAMKEWFKEKINKTYIYINENYNECDVLNYWVKSNVNN